MQVPLCTTITWRSPLVVGPPSMVRVGGNRVGAGVADRAPEAQVDGHERLGAGHHVHGNTDGATVPHTRGEVRVEGRRGADGVDVARRLRVDRQRAHVAVPDIIGREEARQTGDRAGRSGRRRRSIRRHAGRSARCRLRRHAGRGARRRRVAVCVGPLAGVRVAVRVAVAVRVGVRVR